MKRIKQITGFLLLAGASLTLLSCEKSPTEACDSLEKEGVANKKQLIGKWEFKSFNKKGGIFKSQDKPPEELDEINIIFKDSNQVVINGPVNKCFGNFFLKQANLISLPSNMVSSDGDLRGCTRVGRNDTEEEWENRYLRAIGNTKCYTIKNAKQLLLYYDNEDNKNLMKFTKK